MSTKLKSYVSAALFTAIISVCAQIVFPLPSGIPFTLQTLAVCLCGYLLNAKYSFLSVCVYLLLGLFGVPVFSYFSGGPAILLGKNGGFLFGFILLAFLCSISRNKKRALKIVLGVIGILLCHITGVIQFSIIFGGSVLSSALLISLPTLPKDLLCVLIAVFVSEKIKFN